MLSLKKIFYGISTVAPRLGSILGLVAPTFTSALITLADAAVIAVDASLGGTFLLTCATNAAREISVPTNGVAGQRLTVRLINTSGGVLTLTTFAAAIKQPPSVRPGTGTQMEYELVFDGTTWAMMMQTPTQVPV